MRRLVDIDLLGDEQLQAQMATASLAVVVAGVLAGVLASVVVPHEAVDLWWFVALAVLSVGALPVHELVHAAAFKLASGLRAKVTFGFEGWMLYTTAPGCVLPRHAFCAVLLAPAVCVTAALGMGCVLAGYPLLGWFSAVMHLAGCTGDIGYVRVIASEPQANLVEDTARGIALLHDE